MALDAVSGRVVLVCMTIIIFLAAANVAAQYRPISPTVEACHFAAQLMNLCFAAREFLIRRYFSIYKCAGNF